MKFTLLAALALASTTLSAPLDTLTKRQAVDPAILAQLSGQVQAQPQSQPPSGTPGGQLGLSPDALAQLTAAGGSNSTATPMKRDPQVDVAGILEKLPGVIGALKGGNSTGAPAPAPGAGGASAGGIAGILEQLPGVIGALKDKEGVTGAAPAAPGVVGAAPGGIMKN